MSDAGGTEYKELLKALSLLYKHNHIETPQYKALAADIISYALDKEEITADDAMAALLVYRVI